MGTSTSPGQDSAADSGPSTLEIVISILALILALAAVAVAMIQVHQARTGRVRPTDTESQTAIDPSRTSTTQQAPAQVVLDPPDLTISRTCVTTSRQFSYDSDSVLKSKR
jgi:hypothetical protein